MDLLKKWCSVKGTVTLVFFTNWSATQKLSFSQGWITGALLISILGLGGSITLGFKAWHAIEQRNTLETQLLATKAALFKMQDQKAQVTHLAYPPHKKVADLEAELLEAKAALFKLQDQKASITHLAYPSHRKVADKEPQKP